MAFVKLSLLILSFISLWFTTESQHHHKHIDKANSIEDKINFYAGEYGVEFRQSCANGYDQVLVDDGGRVVNVVGNNVVIDGQIISINQRRKDGTVQFLRANGGTSYGRIGCILKDSLSGLNPIRGALQNGANGAAPEGPAAPVIPEDECGCDAVDNPQGIPA